MSLEKCEGKSSRGLSERRREEEGAESGKKGCDRAVDKRKASNAELTVKQLEIFNQRPEASSRYLKGSENWSNRPNPKFTVLDKLMQIEKLKQSKNSKVKISTEYKEGVDLRSFVKKIQKKKRKKLKKRKSYSVFEPDQEPNFSQSTFKNSENAI